MIWHDIISYVWYDMIWCGMISYDMISYDIMSYGMRYEITSHDVIFCVKICIGTMIYFSTLSYYYSTLLFFDLLHFVYPTFSISLYFTLLYFTLLSVYVCESVYFYAWEEWRPDCTRFYHAASVYFTHLLAIRLSFEYGLFSPPLHARM